MIGNFIVTKFLTYSLQGKWNMQTIHTIPFILTNSLLSFFLLFLKLHSNIAAPIPNNPTIPLSQLSIAAQHAFFPATLLKARFDNSSKAGALIQQGF